MTTLTEETKAKAIALRVSTHKSFEHQYVNDSSNVKSAIEFLENYKDIPGICISFYGGDEYSDQEGINVFWLVEATEEEVQLEIKRTINRDKRAKAYFKKKLKEKELLAEKKKLSGTTTKK